MLFDIVGERRSSIDDSLPKEFRPLARDCVDSARMFAASLIPLLLLLSESEAFSPSQMYQRQRHQAMMAIHQKPQQRRMVLLLAETSDVDEQETVDGDGDNKEEAPSASVPFEAGTHDELMYALGVNLARQLGDVRPLVESGEELASVAKGLLDTVIGRLATEEQVDLLQRRGGELNELITDRATKIKQRLEEAGKEMLEEMKQVEGAQTLDSGVVLHVLEHGPEGEGRGVRPTKASTVKIHYHGTLADGTVFDTTLGGDPVTFPLAGVIQGWRDGVLKMHEGETAMLGIPPSQGYGEAGTPDGRIPGGSTLFFKIQLLEVMTAGVGGSPTLLGADGKKMRKAEKEGTGLLGADGKPL